jgi:hypothetical protein
MFYPRWNITRRVDFVGNLLYTTYSASKLVSHLLILKNKRPFSCVVAGTVETRRVEIPTKQSPRLY